MLSRSSWARVAPMKTPSSRKLHTATRGKTISQGRYCAGERANLFLISEHGDDAAAENEIEERERQRRP